MLTSTLGVRLTALVGDRPAAAQPELSDALRAVEVTNDADSGDGFQLDVQPRPPERRSTADLLDGVARRR